GVARYVPRAPAGAPDLAALRARLASGPRAADEAACAALHARFARLGIEYGATHRVLLRLRVDGDEALAELAPAADGIAQHELHPGTLDAALQPMLALLGERVGDGVPVVPYRIERAEIHAPTHGARWAWLRMRPDAHEWIFDVDLCDARGALCVALRGIAVTAWRRPDEVVRLEPVWRAAPVEADLHDERAGLDAQRVVFVCGAHGAPRAWPADGSAPVRYAALAAGAPPGEPDALAGWFEAHALALFDEVRRLLAPGMRQATLVQIVVPAAGPGAILHALGALLQTAHLENPLLHGQVIAIDDIDAPDLPRRLARDARRAADTRIRYVNGERQVACFDEAAAPDGARALPWRQGGVYLVTGAAGGLARALADAIARGMGGDAPRATLVLTGRSPARDDMRALVASLCALGVAADYRVLDVADRDAVARMVEAIVGEFGALHGVVHCAGVLRDNYLLRKSADEFAQVLAPKVRGTVNLDRATRDVRSLDFFVTFSSGAGVVGNPGQADYAVANAFMDAFAAHRASLGAARPGVSVSIAWPIWQAGGMRIDRQTEAELERRLAMRPMPTALGLDALHACLLGASPCPTVIHGARARILALARQGFAAPPAAPPGFGAADRGADAPGADADADADAVKARVRAAIDGALSAVLKLPDARLREPEYFESYGIDSINAIRLTVELERTFGPLPKTLFFEYRHADELERYLVSVHGAAVGARIRSAARGAPAGPACARAGES
ncbi:type I polyketide synthase, partial [Burkholderia pseudomallei]